MALTPDEFVNLLNGGKETTDVEFKTGGPRTSPVLFAWIARATLAMTNRRFGGWVLTGVEKDGTLAGLSDPDLATWLEHDEVTAGLNAYAEAESFEFFPLKTALDHLVSTRDVDVQLVEIDTSLLVFSPESRTRTRR